mmetsp:Transcript_24338/g.39169  ORF Transcript_24338/g.39169 Transcript_24338/m.39169 type:complete len:255 (-) Transcript_24338:239-1003(-)
MYRNILTRVRAMQSSMANFLKKRIQCIFINNTHTKTHTHSNINTSTNTNSHTPIPRSQRKRYRPHSNSNITIICLRHTPRSMRHNSSVVSLQSMCPTHTHLSSRIHFIVGMQCTVSTSRSIIECSSSKNRNRNRNSDRSKSRNRYRILYHTKAKAPSRSKLCRNIDVHHTLRTRRLITLRRCIRNRRHPCPCRHSLCRRLRNRNPSLCLRLPQARKTQIFRSRRTRIQWTPPTTILSIYHHRVCRPTTAVQVLN